MDHMVAIVYTKYNSQTKEMMARHAYPIVAVLAPHGPNSFINTSTT